MNWSSRVINTGTSLNDTGKELDANDLKKRIYILNYYTDLKYNFIIKKKYNIWERLFKRTFPIHYLGLTDLRGKITILSMFIQQK